MRYQQSLPWHKLWYKKLVGVSKDWNRSDDSGSYIPKIAIDLLQSLASPLEACIM